jgi:hypothetical protein
MCLTVKLISGLCSTMSMLLFKMVNPIIPAVLLVTFGEPVKCLTVTTTHPFPVSVTAVEEEVPF